MRRKHIILLLVATLAAGELPYAAGTSRAPSNQANSGKLDRFLEDLESRGEPGERVRIIVTARHGLREHVKTALHTSGSAVVDEHALIDAVTAEVPVGRLRALANRDDIASLSVDAVVSAGADNVGTLAGNMLLPTLGIAGSADIGTDVGVAILDSGIVYHDQIPVAAFYDFLRGGAKIKQYDDYGHGTHVAGAIRNKDDRLDARYRSVAPGSRLIGMKVLAADGSGYSSNVISALEFAIANKQALKIDVINLSLGHPVMRPQRPIRSFARSNALSLPASWSLSRPETRG